MKFSAFGLGSSNHLAGHADAHEVNVLYVYVLLEFWTCFVAENDTLAFERTRHTLVSSKWILSWIDLIHRS